MNDPRRMWRRAAACVALGMAALAGCSPQGEAPPAPERPVLVEWEGVSFREGDRVRIVSRAGTFKPEDTGHHAEVVADAGHAGVVVGAERRSLDLVNTALTEPLQVLRVRFEPQTWVEYDAPVTVTLPAFEAALHVSYLEPVKE